MSLGLDFFIWEVGREEHRRLSAHRQLLSPRASTLAHEKPGQGGRFHGGGPRGQAGGQPSPIPPAPLPRARGTSDRVPTHVVKHLTLGGAVLLGDGVGHCIRAHEQRVPVVTAESEAEQRGQTVAEWGQFFSDAKPVRNKLVGLPS